ncbi:hypothetical protein DFH07DRAFT_523520 [Mycena maculata]|uniref:BTB domain-containing protein n=1 Tax=Mycena maculata TaxID=230809 RepID=A0AAD7IWH3_9AGAR|nr:hypothetical protein DFH07DRAFT_523520 [Mycena maculata]
MFAKMALLRAHSHGLDTYLAGITGEGFAESRKVDLDVHIPEEERFTEYDYMSDSDLDTDDEEESPPVIPSGLEGAEILDQDSGIVTTSSRPSPPARMGHVVVVKGHAYKTWSAFLHYLYTEKIAFRTSESPGDPTSPTPECSAKSMYRLADAFGLTDLKALALESLRSRLSVENIVDETFSSFTSCYPEIQDIEVELLIQHLPHLTEKIKDVLKDVCDGARPQSFNVLQKVVCRGTIAAQQSPHVERTATPPIDWAAPPRAAPSYTVSIVRAPPPFPFTRAQISSIRPVRQSVGIAR